MGFKKPDPKKNLASEEGDEKLFLNHWNCFGYSNVYKDHRYFG